MKKDTTFEVSEYIRKATILYSSGKLTEAKRLAEKAVEIETENASAHSILGATYYGLGDMMNAVFHFERACRLFVANKEYNKPTMMNFANSLIRFGRLKNAISMLEDWQFIADPDFTNRLNQVHAMRYEKITKGLHDVFMHKSTDVIFGLMHSHRLGHLIMNTELLLRLIQLGRLSKENKYILIGSEYPANKQLVDMYKRHLSIIENTELFTCFLNYKDAFSTLEHYIDTYSLYDGTQYEELNSTNTTISFTDEEEKKGVLELEKIGIKNKDWFVCIFARDSEYLKVNAPNADWSYHDYRDMDVNAYHKAIKFIIDKGGYVVRMGQIIGQKLNYRHKKMIHYGGSGLRSDFMDVYLSAKCRFYIGSPSGASEIAATAFEVPVLTVNITPIGVKPLSKNALYIPQKLKQRVDNSYVSYPKIFNKFSSVEDLESMLDGNKFRESGYLYESNTEDEILDATIEMYQRVNSEYRPDAADQELLNSYFELYPENHFSRKNKTPIALSFLKRNRELFLNKLNYLIYSDTRSTCR